MTRRCKIAFVSTGPQLDPPGEPQHRNWLPLAIAASVAVVAVLSVQRLDRSVPGGTAPAVARQQPAAAPAQAQFAQVNAVQNQDSGMTGQRQQEFSPRLSSYLVNHSEYKTSLGMQGMLPYVRIVGYESDQ